MAASETGADVGFERGFVAPADVVDRLKAIFDDLELEEQHLYFSSNVHCERTRARDIDQQIKTILGPLIDQWLPGLEPFVAALISKGARQGARVEFHQDWTFTDERVHRSTMLWMPLIDVSLTNGAMAFVPGSHRWNELIRTDAPDQPSTPWQRQLAERAVLLPLRAGESVTYDPAVLHGSTPNVSGEMRPAVGIGLAPRGAPLMLFHESEAGNVSGYEIDESFHTTAPFRSRPPGEPVPPWNDVITSSDFAVHLTSATTAPPGRHATTWDIGSSPVRSPLDLAPTLADAALDRRLARDGFVTFPLIGQEVAAQLRSEFGRLHGWTGSGFEADLTIDEPSYRAAVDAVLAESLDTVLRRSFTDHEPFLRNFLCKWPGSGSELYLHQDWMYVDERSGANTHVVWIALQDVDGHNGQLRVLRGSHLVDPSLRGTDLTAPWIDSESWIVDRLESVPVRAGECIVINNALVHSSFPNHTTVPRVVAAIGMRPSSSPLVYFRRADGAHAARYDVDEEFFRTITPARLHGGPPDLPVAETIELVGHSITSSELARRLPTPEGLIRRQVSALAGALERVSRARRPERTGRRS